jgi:glycosyltransferase involved in cell wall biosynthesis
MPLFSNLDEQLPFPSLKNVKVFWPDRYSWHHAEKRLDMIKRIFSRTIPVFLYDIKEKKFDWHVKGGFPVPDNKSHLIGEPCFPRGPNDIRGEIFEIHFGDEVVRCAYDYSDYPIISTEILDEVDIYFKCIVPNEPLPSKVVSVGYYAQNTELLSKARDSIIKKKQKKEIDVYGRFGSWTDGQGFRERIVNNLKSSPVNFVGGFGNLKIYPAYLTEIAKAKIALDVPGQAPITCRLVEGMALGAIIVCRKPSCVFPEEIIDGKHYVSIKEDATDVAQVCMELLEDEKRRQFIVDQGMCYYDRNFSPQSMVRRMLRESRKLISH